MKTRLLAVLLCLVTLNAWGQNTVPPSYMYYWNGSNWVAYTGSSGGTSIPTAQAANPTSVSGTITSGGTAQLLVAAASAGVTRHVLIQNLSTDPLCFSKFTTTPVCGTNGTYTLNPATASTGVNSGSYSTPPGLNDSNAIYIIGATTGDKFTAETQ